MPQQKSEDTRTQEIIIYNLSVQGQFGPGSNNLIILFG